MVFVQSVRTSAQFEGRCTFWIWIVKTNGCQLQYNITLNIKIRTPRPFDVAIGNGERGNEFSQVSVMRGSLRDCITMKTRGRPNFEILFYKASYFIADTTRSRWTSSNDKVSRRWSISNVEEACSLIESYFRYYFSFCIKHS